MHAGVPLSPSCMQVLTMTPHPLAHRFCVHGGVPPPPSTIGSSTRNGRSRRRARGPSPAARGLQVLRDMLRTRRSCTMGALEFLAAAAAAAARRLLVLNTARAAPTGRSRWAR
jgi:hypothetical protein